MATHRFAARERAAGMAEQILLTLALVPAADADDRKYLAKLAASAESLSQQLAGPASSAG